MDYTIEYNEEITFFVKLQIPKILKSSISKYF